MSVLSKTTVRPFILDIHSPASLYMLCAVVTHYNISREGGEIRKATNAEKDQPTEKSLRINVLGQSGARYSLLDR